MNAKSECETLVAVDPLVASVLKIMRSASETLLPYEADLLSQTDCEAFNLLVERGLLWRRQLLEVTCPGTAGVLQITIDTMGDISQKDLEDRIEHEVIEPNIPAAWKRLFSTKVLKRRERAAWGWLSSEGQVARQDIDLGNEIHCLRWAMSRESREGAPVPSRVHVRNHEFFAAQSQSKRYSETGQDTPSVVVGVQTIVNASYPDLAPELREIADALKGRSNQQADAEETTLDPVATECKRGIKTGSREAVISWLASHHREDQDPKPALTAKVIAREARCSPTTVSRALSDVFGNSGYQGYVSACEENAVAQKINQHRGDGIGFGTASNHDLDQHEK